MDYSSTIVALCSGPIKAAVSMIRVSGSEAFAITEKLFTNKQDKEHQKAYYGFLKDGEKTIDEVMVFYYFGPHSFTGEDMVEITCHGSMFIVSTIINLYIKHGAKMASRGEFSQRAFINGRIDLVNAEAINDLVNANNEASASLALNALKGNTSKVIEALSQRLLDIISQIEVNIDYPEYDDIEQLTHESVEPALVQFINDLDLTIKETKKGQIIKDGINTVILGRPNVGKSSLLNYLLKQDKAIVTDVAGTTRDIVEGQIDFNGVRLNLIDTAGIHESVDKIEQIGIEKSLEALDKANLVLVMLNNEEGLNDDDKFLLEKSANANRIIIINKTEGKKNIELKNACYISIKNNNIKELEDRLNTVLNEFNYENEPLLFNARQEGLLLSCKEHLLSSLDQARNGQVIDIISIDITLAYQCLLEILGKTNKEDLLNNIFSKFCLGK